MGEVLLLTDELVKNGIFDMAQFIWFSEPAAMGCGGEIIIVTDEGKIVEGNYNSSELSIKLITEEFPYLSQKGLDELIERSSSKDGEIKYFYMECGNHLLIRENVYEFFIDLNDGIQDFVKGHWLEMAKRICPNKERREKLAEILFYCENVPLKIPDIYPFGTDQEINDFLDCWSEYDPFLELK